MKKLMLIVMAGLLLGALTAPALAWEFEMKGDWQYRWRYFGRTGEGDLFGNAALQETGLTGAFTGTRVMPAASGVLPAAAAFTAPWVGFAGPSHWGRGAWQYNNPAPAPGVGASYPGQILFITRGGFSTWGSDAHYWDQRIKLHPAIRVNSQIRVHGVYNIGGYRNEFTRYDLAAGSAVSAPANLGGASMGVPPFEQWMGINAWNTSAYGTASLGSWEQVRATFTTPWATFSLGMKSNEAGTGTWNTYGLRGTGFALVVPYGPFRLLYFHFLTNSYNFGAGTWNFTPDGTNSATWFDGALFTYDNADLHLGGVWLGRLSHQIAALGYGTSAAAHLGGEDGFLNMWAFWLKYFNGRFFANLEYDWFVQDFTRLPNVAAGAAPFVVAAPRYREGYTLGAEIGTVMGPTKLSFVWAQASGAVLNNGNRTKIYNTNPLESATYLEPYQYLMFDTYAGGNQIFAGVLRRDEGEYGFMSDAYAFGGRLDYAVAANLNVWGSYLWAHRLEQNGYFFGHFDNTGVGPAGVLVGYTPSPTAPVGMAIAGIPTRIATNMANYGRQNPYVDNGYLGWEAQAGVDWKLLEGLTTRFRYAYWAPGEWFQQAYESIGVRGGAVVNNALFQSKDAIQAFEGKIIIEF